MNTYHPILPRPESGAGPIERYVTGPELGRVMGLSLSTINRMLAAGMPSVSWGVRTRRYRPSECIAWAAARESCKLNAGSNTDVARRAP
jgi:hypothetical protein